MLPTRELGGSRDLFQHGPNILRGHDTGIEEPSPQDMFAHGVQRNTRSGLRSGLLAHDDTRPQEPHDQSGRDRTNPDPYVLVHLCASHGLRPNVPSGEGPTQAMIHPTARCLEKIAGASAVLRSLRWCRFMTRRMHEEW